MEQPKAYYRACVTGVWHINAIWCVRRGNGICKGTSSLRCGLLMHVPLLIPEIDAVRPPRVVPGGGAWGLGFFRRHGNATVPTTAMDYRLPFALIDFLLYWVGGPFGSACSTQYTGTFRLTPWALTKLTW